MKIYFKKKVKILEYQSMCQQYNSPIMDFQQITFVTVNGFCSLSKTPFTHASPILNRQYKNG